MNPGLRTGLSRVCFGLGSVWAVAGAARLIFGTRITIPILPPLGLEQVRAWEALVAALGLFGAAAWLGRSSAATRRQAVSAREHEQAIGRPH